jgi:phosphoribosylanthranilate isomerase
MTLVKVCGIRSVTEGRTAIEAGADYLGFNFWRPSKRYIEPRHAADIITELRRVSLDWSAVGVFADPTLQDVRQAAELCGLDYVQLSGDESVELVGQMPRPTLKVVHVRTGVEQVAAGLVQDDAYHAYAYLLDTHDTLLPGGSGKAFDWAALRAIGPRCLVAGGLRPDNVATAIATLAPLGVDVASGVEFPSGGKDPRLVRAFLEAVHSYDRQHP